MGALKAYGRRSWTTPSDTRALWSREFVREWSTRALALACYGASRTTVLTGRNPLVHIIAPLGCRSSGFSDPLRLEVNLHRPEFETRLNDHVFQVSGHQGLVSRDCMGCGCTTHILRARGDSFPALAARTRKILFVTMVRIFRR